MDEFIRWIVVILSLVIVLIGLYELHEGLAYIGLGLLGIFTFIHSRDQGSDS